MPRRTRKQLVGKRENRHKAVVTVNRSPTQRRYRALMKDWRRLQRMAEQAQPRQRKRVLEELRALDLEERPEEWSA